MGIRKYNKFTNKEVSVTDLVKFEDKYSEKELFDKLKFMVKILKKAGAKLIYPALLLYLVLAEDSTPVKTKASIIGALGYLIAPLDFIPDVVLGFGFSDDFTALCVAIATIRMYITQEIKEDAKKIIAKWIPDINECDFDNLDKLLRI